MSKCNHDSDFNVVIHSGLGKGIAKIFFETKDPTRDGFELTEILLKEAGFGVFAG